MIFDTCGELLLVGKLVTGTVRRHISNLHDWFPFGGLGKALMYFAVIVVRIVWFACEQMFSEHFLRFDSPEQLVDVRLVQEYCCIHILLSQLLMALAARIVSPQLHFVVKDEPVLCVNMMFHLVTSSEERRLLESVYHLKHTLLLKIFSKVFSLLLLRHFRLRYLLRKITLMTIWVSCIPLRQILSLKCFLCCLVHLLQHGQLLLAIDDGRFTYE